jgi:hypothetical protein
MMAFISSSEMWKMSGLPLHVVQVFPRVQGLDGAVAKGQCNQRFRFGREQRLERDLHGESPQALKHTSAATNGLESPRSFLQDRRTMDQDFGATVLTKESQRGQGN